MFSLKEKHTLRINSVCNDFVQIRNAEELYKLRGLSNEVFILGGGSNVAFVDNYAGTVVSYCGNEIKISENNENWIVEADAGVEWHRLVCKLVKLGISGVENLALIPGNCGAAPVQNIGAYGVEFSDICHSVHCLDLHSGTKHVFSSIECQFSYRNSVFKSSVHKSLLIVKVILHLPKIWHANLSYPGLRELNPNSPTKQVMERVIKIRQAKLPDPAILPNAGSFFKNPIIAKEEGQKLLSKWPELPLYPANQEQVKLSAGWLIERAGLKGQQTGGIGSYQKHALVLVNHGDGTGKELLQFARAIRDKVFEVFGVTLENEVLLMGKEGALDL